MYCINCGNQIKKIDKFCDNCGEPNKPPMEERPVQVEESEPSKPTLHTNFLNNKLVLIIILIFVVFGAIIYAANINDKKNKQNSLEAAEKERLRLEQETLENLKKENLKSVVNIACDDGSGGSGTIISKEGLVLTNNHVVSNASVCLVALADTNTGEPIAIYKSTPVIVPGLSEGYDIAMLNITSSYTDEENKTWGSYPTDFPAYVKPDNCDKTTSKLGDAIKIYGYPVTSGGANLTVTEGIISSFSDDGNILTSAKIDSGNSGGFAVDYEGCFVGIPSAVVQGNYQNFGIIISGENIQNFVDEVPPAETSNKIIEDIEPEPQTESFDQPSAPITEVIKPDDKLPQTSQPKPTGVAFQSKLYAAGEEYVPVANYYCSDYAATRANELYYYSSFAPVSQAIEQLNSSTPGTERHDLFEERYYQALAEYNDKVREYNYYLSTNCSLI